jgi:uncharacterized protein YecE (DUF72 family)
MRERSELLPFHRRYRYAFEFRHPSWFCDEVYEVLRESEVALCIWDLKGTVSPLEVTANLVYLRLHGPTTRAYRGSYPAKTLRPWGERIREWKRTKKTILCYFDNDENGYAPVNALQLVRMLGNKKA